MAGGIGQVAGGRGSFVGGEGEVNFLSKLLIFAFKVPNYGQHFALLVMLAFYLFQQLGLGG